MLDVRRSSSSGTSSRRLAFGFLNIRSLANKVDDLLEVRRDRAVDVLCLAETWYDADSVCIRRLHSGGYRVVDRPRPHPSSESSSMSTNHGGVAIASVPGVRLSTIILGVDSASFEMLCTRIVLESFISVVVVIYRPVSEAVTTVFF